MTGGGVKEAGSGVVGGEVKKEAGKGEEFGGGVSGSEEEIAEGIEGGVEEGVEEGVVKGVPPEEEERE